MESPSHRLTCRLIARPYIIDFSKLLFIGLFFFSALQLSNAQAPDGIRYQGIVRDLDNQLLTNQDVGIQITILQGSENGTNVYRETHTTTTNSAGVFSIKAGAGTVNDGSFTAINWGAGPYFIQQAIDPAGGTNYTISGTTEILSVPYALYADKSGKSTSAETADIAEDLSEAARGFLSLPVGAIIPYAGTTLPNEDWLWCDGAAYQASVYEELGSVLGNAYGTEGGGFFRVPDLRGRGMVGTYSNTTNDTTRVAVALGGSGGKVQHTLQESELPAHEHGISEDVHDHYLAYDGNDTAPFNALSENFPTVYRRSQILSSEEYQLSGTTLPADVGKTSPYTHAHGGATAPTGGNMPHPTLDPYLGINFIIKAR